jgi:hypothetical protein
MGLRVPARLRISSSTGDLKTGTALPDVSTNEMELIVTSRAAMRSSGDHTLSTSTARQSKCGHE